MQGWNRYFRGLPYNVSKDTDIQIHLKRLASEGPRIFCGQGDIERWKINPTGLGTYSTNPTVVSLTV